MKNIALYVANELAPLVNSFRVLQQKDGSVSKDRELAATLLLKILDMSGHVYSEISKTDEFHLLQRDVQDWLHKGLDKKPNFRRVAGSLRPPLDGEMFFAVAPVRCPNSYPPHGFFLECALAEADEPKSLKYLRERYNHKKNNPCQSTRLLAASRGFEKGNCIVLFPENVSTFDKVSSQEYAVFFFNKFQKIYTSETLTAAKTLFDLDQQDLFSIKLDGCQTYEARCVWGYLHDYFHHVGVRPLDKNLNVKTNWYAGLLEEIKVDCEAALACLEDDRIPYGSSVYEFIVLDRLCRYPLQVDSLSNFDSGTGLLLMAWLSDQGCFRRTSTSALQVRAKSISSALRSLVNRITNIESEPDDDVYLRNARTFVESQIGQGRHGERYLQPSEHPTLSKLLGSSRATNIVNDFYDLCL